MEEKKYPLVFRGSKGMSLIPLVVMIAFAVYFFGFAGVYDLSLIHISEPTRH